MERDHQERSNEQWLSGLREHGTGGGAAEALTEYLRKGLCKALRGRADATELEDLTQDALLRILQGLDSFRGDSRFTTWAMAVALRGAFGAMRRRHYLSQATGRAVERSGGSSLRSLTAPDPGRFAEGADLLGALRRAVETGLTTRQRTAVLGELSGIPTALLAERLAITPGALYKLHHDARKKLRRLMHDAGFSDQDVREHLMQTTEAT